MYKIKTIEKRRGKNTVMFISQKMGSGFFNYEIDIENTIASRTWRSCELNPKLKPDPVVVEIKQQASIADEFIKLKKKIG